MTEKITCAYCGIIGILEERRCLSCGAPFSIPTETVEEDTHEEDRIERIKNICITIEENESCHTKDTIPKKKLRNATDAFEIQENDEIILIYDGTVFGSNKTGFAICESGLYWKNDWATPTKRTYLSWDEFKDRKIKPKSNDYHISLGRGDKVAIVDEDDISELSDLLKRIQELI